MMPISTYTKYFFAVIILLLCSCEKDKVPDPGPVDPSSMDIQIKAYVPSVLYSNIKQVTLDAGPMITAYPQHKFLFSWNCTAFPPGKEPILRDFSTAVATAENLDTGKYTFVLRVRDLSYFNDSAVFNLVVYKDTLTGAPKLIPLPDQGAIFMKAARLSLGLAASLNLVGRPLKIHWYLIEQPVGTSQVTIPNETQLNTEALGLQPGIYTFGLGITNELSLTTVDTFNISVFTDTLTGTTKIYDNLIWTEFPDFV
jgi:hypothetical protein